MHIAIVVERFAPRRGGVENVAWQVAHGLARAGERVTVIAREADPTAEVSIERVAAAARWQPRRLAAFDRAVERLGPEQAGRDEPFDVVHGFARTRRQHLYRAGGGSHADYLERCHGPMARQWRRLSPRHRILLRHERSVFDDPTQRIQCASRLVADRLEALEGVDPERILLLPNGVDVARFAGERARLAGEALRSQLDSSSPPAAGGPSAPRWLFVGSGWRRKGLDILLAALARPELSRHRLWIVGRGAQAAWQRRARRLGLDQRVRFLGERDDVDALYAAADGFVLPTRYDPFANVTFEAAAAGLPIVTTASNGAAEWLAPDLEPVADAEDVAALARSMQRYSEPAVRRALGARLASRVADHDWPRHIAALREEYARIAARSARQAA